MQPVKSSVSSAAHPGRVAPVVGRSRVDLALGADEGAVLDARDVARIGQREVGVRTLGVGELLERAGVDERLGEAVVLLGRAVTPVDGVGLGEGGDLLHPGGQFRVLRRDSGAHRKGQLLGWLSGTGRILSNKRPGRGAVGRKPGLRGRACGGVRVGCVAEYGSGAWPSTELGAPWQRASSVRGRRGWGRTTTVVTGSPAVWSDVSRSARGDRRSGRSPIAAGPRAGAR